MMDGFGVKCVKKPLVTHRSVSFLRRPHSWKGNVSVQLYGFLIKGPGSSLHLLFLLPSSQDNLLRIYTKKLLQKVTCCLFLFISPLLFFSLSLFSLTVALFFAVLFPE